MSEVRKTCCGSIIAEDESVQLTFEYKGKTYYFCGPSCKETFDKLPEAYLAQYRKDGSDEEKEYQ